MIIPVFRFAPSPNGLLHLGHAYSVLVNAKMAERAEGKLLLRIEDIDLDRAAPQHERAIIEDLSWLGIRFDEGVRRQSEHFDDYRAALTVLKDEGLVYPAFMSRGEIRDHVADREAAGVSWPRDPDGALLYPPVDRQLGEKERKRRIAEGVPHAWRLDMPAAIALARKLPSWQETGSGPGGETGRIDADPAVWGDVVLARRDIPASYHLAVVVDDAIQQVTHVVRGRDLFHATSIHRLLQELLGLPVPQYHHHRLVVGADGRKLSKSRRDTAIAELRAAGVTPGDIVRMVGLESD